MRPTCIDSIVHVNYNLKFYNYPAEVSDMRRSLRGHVGAAGSCSVAMIERRLSEWVQEKVLAVFYINLSYSYTTDLTCFASAINCIISIQFCTAVTLNAATTRKTSHNEKRIFVLAM